MTEATVLTGWVVLFAPCLSDLGQAENRKASELEGALESAEPNPSLYQGKNGGPERGRDLFMVIWLTEEEPG